MFKSTGTGEYNLYSVTTPGAFIFHSPQGHKDWRALSTEYEYTGIQYLDLDASHSSSIYGMSSKVQSRAFNTLMIIKN